MPLPTLPARKPRALAGNTILHVTINGKGELSLDQFAQQIHDEDGVLTDTVALNVAGFPAGKRQATVAAINALRAEILADYGLTNFPD
jgi:hypothetical protein